jgi:hypothetical protein
MLVLFCQDPYHLPIYRLLSHNRAATSKIYLHVDRDGVDHVVCETISSEVWMKSLMMQKTLKSVCRPSLEEGAEAPSLAGEAEDTPYHDVRMNLNKA